MPAGQMRSRRVPSLLSSTTYQEQPEPECRNDQGRNQRRYKCPKGRSSPYTQVVCNLGARRRRVSARRTNVGIIAGVLNIVD